MEKFWTRKNKIIFGTALFLAAMNFFVWQEVFALSGPKYLKVNFLDVGQGDSAFIETPSGQQILIDGGPSGAVVGKVASKMPFWDRSLDLVILTHPEKDHMQGLMEVLKRYKADYILWTGVKKTAPEYQEWLNILAKQKQMGAKILIAKAGQQIKTGNVLIDTLYPLESLAGKELKNTSNDTCVVTKIIYGKKSFLFTCDISTVVEKKLIDYENAFLKTDVLKVAHHGSKYSSSELFLAAAAPSLAIISDAKNNSYGHPAPETLKRLGKFDIKIERTDQLGDVQVQSDGQNIKIIN
jgi:competence protein ComEC